MNPLKNIKAFLIVKHQETIKMLLLFAQIHISKIKCLFGEIVHRFMRLLENFHLADILLPTTSYNIQMESPKQKKLYKKYNRNISLFFQIHLICLLRHSLILIQQTFLCQALQFMKKLNNLLKTDKIIKWGILGSASLIIFTLAYISFYYFMIPPFVPLFNQLPWGMARFGTRL